MLPRILQSSLLAVLPLLGLACSTAEPPPVLNLAAGFAPTSGVMAGKAGVWLEAEVTAADWVEDEAGGGWWAPDPFADPALLLVDPAGAGRRFLGSAAEGVVIGGGRIRTRRGESRPPPPSCTVAAFVAVGEQYRPAEPGLPPRWRTTVGGLTSDAVPVWPGGAQSIDAIVPAGAKLFFATSCLGPGADGADSVALRLTLDGKPLFETSLSRRHDPILVRHEVELPAGVEGAVRIGIEAEGPPALVTLHDPVLTIPDLVATEREAAGHQDVTLVLIDTFRADNLAAYGGESGVAPHLDRLATESLRFANARAPSSWTLPSHGTLFTGVEPHQHGAIEQGRGLGGDLVTLAERLAAAGYRTGAVTNSIFVSAPYGMDRGFEWFEERSPTDLMGTLTSAIEFLAADDGRPTFLFVHSYRVHGPYWVTPKTLEEEGERLGLAEGVRAQQELMGAMRKLRLEREQGGSAEGRPMRQFIGNREWPTLIAQVLRAQGVEDATAIEEQTRSILRSLHRLYLGGVFEFDQAFGRFLAELDARGAPENGWLIVTSDHGEAFGEHDALFHGTGAWEEVLRVPLLLRGPGLAPGVDPRHASLVDLPRTIAELVHIPPVPEWEGASLLSPAPSSAAYAFDCAEKGEPSIALLDGRWKIVLGGEAPAFTLDEVRGFFDLDADPGEAHDLRREERRRAGALLDKHREELRRLLQPLQSERSVELDPDLTRQMRGLGY